MEVLRRPECVAGLVLVEYVVVQSFSDGRDRQDGQSLSRELYANFGARTEWYWIALVEVLIRYGVVATT